MPAWGAAVKCVMTSKACIFAEQAAPRYTSYPTAPHFSSSVGPATYTGWLAELPERARLSLYLHVPFCAPLCHYCGCHTKTVRRREPVEDYAKLLSREIDLLGETIGARPVHRSTGAAGRRRCSARNCLSG